MAEDPDSFTVTFAYNSAIDHYTARLPNGARFYFPRPPSSHVGSAVPATVNRLWAALDAWRLAGIRRLTEEGGLEALSERQAAEALAASADGHAVTVWMNATAGLPREVRKQVETKSRRAAQDISLEELGL